MKKLHRLLASILTIISPIIYTQADSSNYWPMRISAWGFAGNHETAKLDWMAPFGNANSIFYLDGQSKYGRDSTWMAGLGAGVRSIYNNSQIFGAYVFADYNVSERSNHYWFISPGVETLGLCWDARVNGYIPISRQENVFRVATADELGITDLVEFSGHSQFNHLFNFFEAVGPGLDAEVGAKIPSTRNSRIYLGGYYFRPKDADNTDNNNIRGVESRLELPINKALAFTVRDTYDNVEHNTFAVGIRLTAGGTNYSPCSPQCIQERMLEPVERNFSTLDKGTGVPTVTGRKDAGRFLQRSNIWFFDASGGGVFDGTLRSCTFEHPCIGTDFTQTTIDTIDTLAPIASFYFTPGTYSALTGTTALTINNGQSLFGRTQDYKAPAVGDNRATFLGSFNLNGNNVLDSIRVINSDDIQPATNPVVGITVADASNVLIHNVEVNVSATPAAALTTNGLFLARARNVTVDNSVIHSEITVTNSPGFVSTSAIEASLGGVENLIINNSLVEAVQTNLGTNTVAAFSVGLHLGANTSVFIRDSAVNAVISTQTNNSLNASFGILEDFSNTKNTLDISHSAINAVANVFLNNNSVNEAIGIGGNQSFETNMDYSTVRGTAFVGGDNNGFSLAQGAAIDGTVTSSGLFATALVSGNNIGTNQAQAFLSDLMFANTSVVDTQAIVNGNNLGNNQAFGLTVSNPTDVINIANSLVKTLAQVFGINTGNNQAEESTGAGIINSFNTIFTTIENP